MAMRGTAIAFVVLLAAVAGPVSGTLKDGLPRPDGYPDVPTDAFGATPPCLDANGVAVTCEWYGFAHKSYSKEGKQCDVLMREVYSNVTLVPIGSMEPYQYYFDSYFVFDTATNESYCLYGCFDLSDTAAAPSPLGTSAPPPLVVSSPPPVVLAPPPLVVSSPPPAVLAPPPLELASPPPAVLAPPPLEVASPPPATLLTPPTTPSPPVAAQPPLAAPPGTSLVNLNGSGFLRPSGFVSFVLSVTLLSFIGLAAF